MSDTTIIEGPDGRLYEIPDDKLTEYAVPGERVAELRRRMAELRGEQGAGPAVGHGAETVEPAVAPRPMPPGHSAMPPGHSAMPPGHSVGPPTSMSINPGGGVVLNFYFQAPPPVGTPGVGPDVGSDAGPDGEVLGYHMTFDESGIPVNHSEMLWGDYIDKQGNPAVGWHSHDPVAGNAQ